MVPTSDRNLGAGYRVPIQDSLTVSLNVIGGMNHLNPSIPHLYLQPQNE